MSCMKVLPVNFNSNISVTLHNAPQEKKIPNQNLTAYSTGLSSAYYLPVSFYGNDNQSVLTKDLKSLKNLHCPYCGTKMLSSDEIKDALSASAKVKSVNDLFKYLNKYEESINPRFKTVIGEVKHVGYANFNKSADEVLENCKQNMKQKSNEAYKLMLTDFDGLLENGEFSEHDKEVLEKCRKNIAEIPENIKTRIGIYKEFSKTLKSSVAELETPAKNKIYMHLNNNVRDAFFNEYLFEQRFGDETSLTKIFLKNLMQYSKSDVRRVSDKIPADIDNIMLSCKHCEVTGKNLRNKDLKKQYYYNHIYELCRAALAGDLHENRAYPAMLQSSVIKNFNNRLAPDNLQPDLRALLKSTGIKNPRYVEFPLTDVPGIYCASCGQKTITHEQKAQIYAEIQDAETIHDLLGVFHKYREVIRPKYAPIVRELEKNIMQQPAIPEASLIKNLKVFAYKNIQDTLSYNIKNVEDIAETYRLKPEEEAAVRKFVSKANNLLLNTRPDVLFSLDSYYEILSELAGDLNSQTRKEIWDACYPNIVADYARQIVLMPTQSVLDKGKPELKIMAEYILNHSLATVDHLDPKSKYNYKRQKNKVSGFPENKYENLVVMCKDCNTSKSSESLNRWVKKPPEMIRNMEKYIAQVKQLRKDKIIGRKFDYYPYEVAAQFSRLTGIDISTTGSY